jgi:hypothetical protein
MPLGAGLITTFNDITTPAGHWIGYQILLGFGIGIGISQFSIAAQTVLMHQDVATVLSLNVFVQQLSGAIFVSVGQNVFNSAFARRLKALHFNTSIILNTGATEIRLIVPQQDL